MDFFDKTRCDRCRKPLLASTMSIFNTQTICMDCADKEEAHPDYKKAQQAEREALQRGDRNFRGIGLPPDLRR